MTKKPKIIGPFSQVVTMAGLPPRGPLQDQELEIVSDVAIKVVDQKIEALIPWNEAKKERGVDVTKMEEKLVLLPGFIDAHTHICSSGTRSRDYALRTAGASYQEIAKQGGGILDTVKKTREASPQELSKSLASRCDALIRRGVTTCEVKSGYGLNVDDELKMLAVIKDIDETHDLDLVSTCLAAHAIPPEFTDSRLYLAFLLQELLPIVKEQDLSNRVDIFIEVGSFGTKDALWYLQQAQKMGFALAVHADQFSIGGSAVASQLKAISAEHLEMSGTKEIKALAKKQVTAVVLPGASLGLGMNFAPARKILDHDCSLVIASDWNPGSAPMGNLLMQAAVLGMAEKLTTAEVFAGLTFRAASVLGLKDRGGVFPGKLADMIAFPCQDWRDILYYQGQLKPSFVWKKGELCCSK